MTLRISFIDGYSLRQLFEYLRYTLTDINLLIGPSNITILESNNTHSLLHGLVLDELVMESMESQTIGINLPEMCRMLKGVSKKDGLLLTITEQGDLSEQRIELRILSSTENISYVMIKDIPVQEFELPYHSYKTPNLTLSPIEWSKLCTSLLSIKPITIEFRCYQQGMKIQALNASHVVFKEYILGEIDNEICFHRIYPETLKGLSKMNQMCVRGCVLKLYFDEIIHFRLKLGVLGDYSLLLRDEVASS